MHDERDLRLPTLSALLEEINLPRALARSLAGQTVKVQFFAEEQAFARRLQVPDDYPVLVKKDGTIWNDYRPVRLQMSVDGSETWRLPRHWLYVSPEPPVMNDSSGRDSTWIEALNLPHAWDLLEVNIPARVAAGCSSAVTQARVKVTAAGPVEVYWRDPEVSMWRIPASWRRRRIQLPDAAILTAQGVPDSIARAFAYRIVSVNYHPGSLCCLAAHFRFRDDDGDKWPVSIADCTVVGFGNGPEHSA